MPAESLARAVLLPELRLTRKRGEPWGGMILGCPTGRYQSGLGRRVP
jgi:hypothetical protein